MHEWKYLNFRFCACFEQGVPWNSGNYRVWIHSETRTWHDKDTQINTWANKNIFRNKFRSIYIFSVESRVFLGIVVYVATVYFSGIEEHSLWLGTLLHLTEMSQISLVLEGAEDLGGTMGHSKKNLYYLIYKTAVWPLVFI